MALALLLPSGQLAAKLDTTEDHYNHGWEAYEIGRYQAAFLMWKQLAQQNHELALINMGAMYDTGQGVPQDPVKALESFKHPESGDTIILEDASCALKIESVRDTLAHLPKQSPTLPTLPRRKADIDTLANRLHDSLIIVISR